MEDLFNVALTMAALAAIVHVHIFVLESIRWEQPGTPRAFGLTGDQAATTTAVVLATSDPRKARAAPIQGVPPTLALLALGLWALG